MAEYILSLDQGTTSSRALVFDASLNVVGVSQIELEQHYPRSGWVEHDPVEILVATVNAAKGAVAEAGVTMAEMAAVGISNQRETTVLWERATGRPVANAIVWQDRRTSALCRHLRADGAGAMVAEKTGLLLDPYFSATKLKWLLDEVEGARDKARRGELCFGTIDSWLIWNLTGGKSHVIDATNASRTMLFNIIDGCWDEELLRLFDIPASVLPAVQDCIADFGMTARDMLGAEVAIGGVAGDQHAALIGQACFEPGMMKSTYGTGCFAVMNIGEEPVVSSNNLLTTLAYQVDGKRCYALEGSIFVAGAAVQWLRDELGVIRAADECDGLAAQSNAEDPVVLVPAFAGLGAPYWQADVRGALMNLSRGSGRAEIVRAALESVGYQSLDLMRAMARDREGAAGEGAVLRVDGGMARSDWSMQFLSDILQCPVERPGNTETTALGAAYLAGRSVDLCPDFASYGAGWRAERRFAPQRDAAWRDEKYRGWQKCVNTLIDGEKTDV